MVAALLGAMLGMAAGHGLAWRTAPPLPEDDGEILTSAQCVRWRVGYRGLGSQPASGEHGQKPQKQRPARPERATKK